MLDKLKHWLGLEKMSTYVRDFFEAANIRSSIYMACITVALEIYMLYTAFEYAVAKDMFHNTDWMISHFGWYFLLLGAGLAILIYSILYQLGKRPPRLLWHVLKWIFTIVGLAFGIHFGINSYAKGDQILSFMTMVIFIMCMLVWRPVISTVLSIAAFSIFYYLMQKTGDVTLGNQINLFTTWLTIFMVCISAYRQRISDATKSEKLQEMNTYLRRAAVVDELTGIPNMRSFREESRKYYAECTKAGIDTDLLYFDIEHFKSYNERYGHEAGDDLLRTFAKVVVQNFDGYPVARWSDDHFVIMVRRDDGEARVRKTEAQLHELQGEVNLELKIGAYHPRSADENLDLAIENARSACGTLKKRYSETFREYDNKLDEELSQKQYIINHIDSAVRDGHIEAFYQPLIRTSDEKLCGLEALARWRDPEHGLLMPFRFISTLEEHRQIHKLDQEIIRIVCRDLAHAEEVGLEHIPVSINFSRLDFELYDVPATLQRIADEYGVPCHNIDVEITESALTGNAAQLQKIMETIRGHGYSQWLDDFGSGYSSLNVLKDFHFDVLKIDMIFLRGFETNPNCKLILKSIVDLAKSLGLSTLTEGVETREQFEFLREIGCDKAQGYYFGKPMPREELLKAIAEGKLVPMR